MDGTASDLEIREEVQKSVQFRGKKQGIKLRHIRAIFENNLKGLTVRVAL
jgi:hypothetical protein